MQIPILQTKQGAFRLRFVLAGIAALFQLVVQAQISANSQMVQYDQAVSTKFVLNAQINTENWTALDWLYVQPFESKNHLEKSLNSQGQLTTIITHISDSRLESWMSAPHQTVIDGSGTRIFDASGNLLTHEPHSAKSLAYYTPMNASLSNGNMNLAHSFPVISAEKEAQLIASGWGVQHLPGRKLELSRTGMQMLIDMQQLSVQWTLMEGEKTRLKTEQRFKSGPNGAIVPDRLIERSYPVLPNGACVEQVTTTVFTNYQFSQGLPRDAAGRTIEDENSTRELVAGVMPNPAADNLQISLAPGSGETALEVFDTAGKCVLSQKHLGNSNCLLPIASLTEGIYFLSVTREGRQQMFRFIKQ